MSDLLHAPTSAAPDLPESEAADAGVQEPAKKPGRALRLAASLAVFVVALLVLWPAQYGGFTGLTVVHGHSMEPTYHTGDLVISLRQPAYSVGDIVSYQVPKGQAGEGGRVIHRIFSIDASSGTPVYSTKGDNNPSVDPWHFSPKDVLGKAIISAPAVGSMLGGAANPIVVGLAAGILVTVFLWRFGSDPKKKGHRGDPQG